MADFGVKPAVLQQTVQTEQKLAANLSAQAGLILTIRTKLNMESTSVTLIKSSLKKAAAGLETEQKNLLSMAEKLEEIRNLYINTENRILGDVTDAIDGTADALSDSAQAGSTVSSETEAYQAYLALLIAALIARIRDLFIPEITPVEIDSIVYDEDGEYGGDQASPKDETSLDRREELYDAVRSYYPDENLTDEQISSFLKKLNSEGCGYVALVNTIFSYFAGNAEGFEEAFGFSMYEADGSLNYDRLLVDLYASMDNHEDGGDKVNRWEDYSWSKDGFPLFYDYWDDTTGSGTNQYTRETYLETYMRNHGVAVDVTTDANVTVYNYHKYVESGEQVIVAVHNINLYNMDGTVKQYIDGGHAMTVTGVTEDGKFIVSSWGGKYYIDPSEFPGNSVTFSTVSYE